MDGRRKVLFFDNDGVLAHTEELFFETNRKVFGEMGIPYTRHEFENHTFVNSLGTAGYMRGLGYGDTKIKEFKKRRDEFWQTEITKRNVVEPTAEKVLSSLKPNYRIGIVTNTNRGNFNKTYHSSTIPTLVEFVIYREDYDHGKPEPDAYLKALEVAAVSPDEAIVIEDSPRGIMAAKTAGLSVIALANPVIPNLDTSQADYHLKNIAGLPDLLETIG